MMPQTALRERIVYILVALLLIATLGIGALIPPGYTVWCLYFLGVALTLFQSQPSVPLSTAAFATALLALGTQLSPPSGEPVVIMFNRGVGAVAIWVVAFVVNMAIRARRNAERLLWLQQGENALASALAGEQTPESLATNAVRCLCQQLDAEVGALYRLEGGRLLLAGGVALDDSQPRELRHDAGQLGETLQLGKVRRVAALPSDHLPVTSALGRSAPAELLLAPVVADGVPLGALELGRLQRADRDGQDLTLLEQSSEIVGIALRTALLRQHQTELLEETRRQREELQAQQEELRVANEELEEQSRALQHSQASLETQQAELEQTNVRLEERTRELEGQKQALLKAQSELVRNARALEAASRYKSEFLANMSHELRTPLNSSLILSRLLADNKDGNLSEEQVKYARAIHDSNSDLLSLINDILDLSKIEAGHIELADDAVALPAVLQRLRETFDPLARQKGLAFAAEIAPGAPAEMVGDAQRLLQILKNLIANALKFTEAGRVSLRRARYRHRHCAGPAGRHLRGVPAGRRQHQPQVRRHRPGPLHLARPGTADGRRHHGRERARARQLLHAGTAARRRAGSRRGARSGDPARHARTGARGGARRPPSRPPPRRRRPRHPCPTTARRSPAPAG